MSRARLALVLSLGVFSSCGGELSEDPPTVSGHVSELTSSQRRVVSERIRDVVAARGISNALLFAGVASAESTMAHCWRDATWACQGPASPDCNGGPVIAGAGDGPCAAQQGGLGMYQFDAGDFDDTLAREGERILRLDGNIEAAVDFVLAMVERSVYVDGVANTSDAIAWVNAVEPQGNAYDDWIKTVTHYYNGCIPSRCSVYDRQVKLYSDHLMARYNEFGHEFWYPSAPPEPQAPCVDCELFEGTLAGRGQSDVHPGGTYFFSSSGRHRAWLIVPDGADFDLRLYRWSRSRWNVVASSFFNDPEEMTDYQGAQGYYAYVVDSYSGSGGYRLYVKRP